MIGISVQMSLYPLEQADIAPAIETFIGALRAHGLDLEVGPMSTLVWGDDEAVFAALQDAYRQATALGPAVLQMTLSNACPLPLGPRDTGSL